MPNVRKVGGAEVAIRDAGRFRPGETYEVDRETAEYLTGRDDFVLVKDDDGTPEDTTGDSVPSEDAEGDGVTSEDTDLAELTHDELKARAEAEGIAEETDLRSKDSIIDALEG